VAQPTRGRGHECAAEGQEIREFSAMSADHLGVAK